MTILLTNDDGIDAPGLAVLAEMLLEFGPVEIVAPAREMSGVGHALTLREPLRVEERPERPEGVRRLAVHGTPADAVKFAMKRRLDAPPDLVVSGPNTGPNVGVNVLYSGTLGAAFEAVVCGVSAVAVSSDLWPDGAFVWDGCLHYARLTVERALAWEAERTGAQPSGEAAHRPFLLNLNVPALPLPKIRGLRVTRHGVSGFNEYYEPHPDDPRAWRIDGDFRSVDDGPDYDAAAVLDGYASLTALSMNLTDDAMRDRLDDAFGGA